MPTETGCPTSISRTLAAPFATHRTMAAAKLFLKEILLVEDQPVIADVSWLLQREKLLCEPAAACVLTAAETIAPSLPEDSVIGLVLCGSNLSLDDLDAWRRQASASPASTSEACLPQATAVCGSPRSWGWQAGRTVR